MTKRKKIRKNWNYFQSIISIESQLRSIIPWTFDDKISTIRTFSDHPSCRSRRSWEYSTRPSGLSSSWTISGTKREQKMGDGMWEIISLVVNRLLSPRITIRYRCWSYCAGRNVHGRWKVTRYRLFSHTMSLGATRSWHDRVKRETDRVLPAKRKYLFCKRFRAYLEKRWKVSPRFISRQIFQNSIERARVSNIHSRIIIWPC